MTETDSAPDDEAEAKYLGQALRNLRKRANLSMPAAAEAIGLTSGEAWRVYEAGTAPTIFKPGVQHKLAYAVGSNLNELLVERDKVAGRVRDGATVVTLRADPFNGGSPALLPIRDRVQAGAWLAADDTGQSIPRKYPAARDGRYAHADQWLSEVVGDSVNRLGINDGDLVHCVDAIAISYYPRTDDVVEVERLRMQGSERELSIKQIVMTPSGPELWPRSTNPRWAEPLSLGEGTLEGEEYEVRIRGLVLAAIRRF